MNNPFLDSQVNQIIVHEQVLDIDNISNVFLKHPYSNTFHRSYLLILNAFARLV